MLRNVHNRLFPNRAAAAAARTKQAAAKPAVEVMDDKNCGPQDKCGPRGKPDPEESNGNAPPEAAPEAARTNNMPREEKEAQVEKVVDWLRVNGVPPTRPEKSILQSLHQLMGKSLPEELSPRGEDKVMADIVDWLMHNEPDVSKMEESALDKIMEFSKEPVPAGDNNNDKAPPAEKPATGLTRDEKEAQVEEVVDYLRSHTAVPTPKKEVLGALHHLTGHPMAEDLSPEGEDKVMAGIVDWLMHNEPDISKIDDANVDMILQFSHDAGVTTKDEATPAADVAAKEDKASAAPTDGAAAPEEKPAEAGMSRGDKEAKVEEVVDWLRANRATPARTNTEVLGALHHLTGHPMAQDLTPEGEDKVMTEIVDWLIHNEPEVSKIDDATLDKILEFSMKPAAEATNDDKPKPEPDADLEVVAPEPKEETAASTAEAPKEEAPAEEPKEEAPAEEPKEEAAAAEAPKEEPVPAAEAPKEEPATAEAPKEVAAPTAEAPKEEPAAAEAPKEETPAPAEQAPDKAEAPKEETPAAAAAPASPASRNATPNDDETIRKILNETHTIAVMGASTDRETQSNQITGFLMQRGYHVIPVNPDLAGTKIHGQTVVAALKDIQEPVDMVDVFLPSEQVPQVVNDAIAIKAKSVWLQVGIINNEAGEKARAAGLDFVQNICPRVEVSRLEIGLMNNSHTMRRMLTEASAIALVGASADEGQPSNQVMAYMIQRGYHVIPVSPDAVGTQILGQDVVASLKDIKDPVDMVQVFKSSEEATQIAYDAIAIGAKSVWLQTGVINDKAGEWARSAGLNFVQNVNAQEEIPRLGVPLMNNDVTMRTILTDTHTVALVGAWSNPEGVSNKVMDFMMQRGYHVIPVNSEAVGTQICGQDVVGSLKDIKDPVDMVHVFRPAEEAPQIVEDAIAIGAHSVWLQVGVINDAAGEKARAAGLNFVQDVCPEVEIPRLGVGLINNYCTMSQMLTETHTIALVGASATPEDRSNQVMDYMMLRGYHVIPVNAQAAGTEVLGQQVVASLQEIQDPVEMILVCTGPEEVKQIVEDAFVIGARSVWLDAGIVNNEAGEQARTAGLKFAQDVSPMDKIPRLGVGLVNNDFMIYQILTETHNIAIMGASPDAEHPSSQVMDYILNRGYHVVPVNPAAAGTKIHGHDAVASLQDIKEPVDMILVFQNPEEVPQIVEDAIAIKAKSIWLEVGIFNDEAGARAREAGLIFVQDVSSTEETTRLGVGLINNECAKSQILTETRTIALVGAAAETEAPSNQAMIYMMQRGYNVIPVNATAGGTKIEGQEVVASLKDIKTPVDMVQVFVASEEVPQVVEDAIAIKAKGVWLDAGIVNDQAGEKARAAGLKFVQDLSAKDEIARIGLGLVNNDNTIRQILTDSRTIALVGASANTERASNQVMEFLIKRGYHVVPVNPTAAGTKILGQEVAETLNDVKEPVDLVLVFRRADAAAQVVQDAIAIRAKSVWLETGIINDLAGESARAEGLNFVQDLCPRDEIPRLGVALVNNDFTMRKMLTETRTIALVGASSNPDRASNQVMEFMMQRGYHVIPVNPTAAGTKILGQTVIASLKEIAEPVDLVQVFRRSEEAPQIVKDAIEISAKSVWLQVGIVSDEAGLAARAAGLKFVQDTCPRVQIPRLGVGLVNNDYSICKILSETKVIALVGASSKPERPSNYVMDFMMKNGYTVIPVNPGAVGTKILEQDVVASLKDIKKPIDAVFVFRPAEEAGQLVDDAIELKMKSVWLALGVINDEAGLRARAAGLNFVQNLCPREQLQRFGFHLQNNSNTIGNTLRRFHSHFHAHFFPQSAKNSEEENVRRILTTTNTIALIGASSNPERSSNFVMDFMLKQGYHVIPVNPTAVGKKILGQDVVGSMSDIKEPIDLVHVFRRSEEAVPIVEEAIRAKAKSVWLQVGVISDEAGKRAQAAGLNFVQNLCPKAEITRMGMGLVNNSVTVRNIINESKTVALIGASTKPERASNFTMDFLMKQGYKVIPVNQGAVGSKIYGQDVVGSLKDIKEAVDMVLVFRRVEEVGAIVDDAIEIKAKSVWLPLGVINDDAGRKARSAGLNFVQNLCVREELHRVRLAQGNNENVVMNTLRRIHAHFFPNM